MIDNKNNYSLIIVGAGPAALTASIYASRYNLDHLIIGEAIGGLAFEAHKICNFPTEIEIKGAQLVEKIQKHVESLGNPIVADRVVGIDHENDGFKLTTQSNKKFFSKTILLAPGTRHRKLNLPNEKQFIGKGLSYCATCDAMFYRDKIVAVIGGSDSAHTASLYLAEIAKKVYQIYRKDRLRGETLWINQVENNNKIEVIYNTEISEIEGKDKIKSIKLTNPYKGEDKIKIDGLFIEIGTVPQKALIEELSLETNEAGYIKIGIDQKTSKKGVWAAGDITNGSNNFRQIITACSEGAIASENIFKFLQEKK